MTPRELLHEHTERVWNQGDLDAVDEFIADEYVEHDPSIENGLSGPDAYRANVAKFRSAFPDLTVTIEDAVVEDDRIAMRQSFGGTHEGTFMGVAPTGTEVESTSMLICRVEDDMIVETWVETDLLGLLEQLGVTMP